MLTKLSKTKYKDKRCLVLIDGANLSYLLKQIEFKIDFRWLRRYFKKRVNLVSIRYYTAHDNQNSKQAKFFNVLKDCGYEIINKELKYIRGKNNNFLKGNMDVEITIDAIVGFCCDTYDVLILVSGDSDFAALIKFLQEKGKECCIMSSQKVISKELSSICDVVDLTELKNNFSQRSSSYEPISGINKLGVFFPKQ